MIPLKATIYKLFATLVAIVLVRLAGTDPVSHLSCDFDSPQNYCKWSSVSAQSSNWKWGHMNTRTVNFTGPLETVDKKGYFIMSYNRKNVGSYEPTATLESPVIDAVNNETCFQFYYFIYGVGVDRLVLSIVNVSTNEETQIWSRRTPSGDMWHLTHIDIPTHTSAFKLKFSAYAGGGAIALDNFIGLQNQCPFDGVCDFESGMCDWKQSNATASNYKFKIIMARDEADQGEMYDHTTQTDYGHLLQARNGKLNDRAVIVKETPAMHSTHCLIFWYYRQKSYKNKLEVLLFGSSDKNISIWKSTLIYPLQTWHRAMVTVSPDQYGYFQRIGISAAHLDTAPIYSPINVDDILLRLGTCPQPITCDFNVDMCGFIHNYMNNDGSETWTWDHGYGRVEYGIQLNFTFPPIDRTGLSNGMFLYTDFTSLRTFYSYRNMQIDSEYVSATNASCLTFYYLAMDSTSNSTTFVVKALDIRGNGKNVWTYSRANDQNTNNQRKHWIEVDIDIQMTTEFKISFEVTTNVSNTYIALDDISYTSGKCSSVLLSTTIVPSQRTSSAVPTGTPPKPIRNPCPPETPYDCKNSDDPKIRVCISKEKVCDFTVECPNNNDERDCGSCTFDKQDLCGWHNVGDSGQKWSLKSAKQFTDHPIIPNYDSSGNKTGSFIIVDTSRGGTDNTPAIISTPFLGATAANCKLTFYYHHSYPTMSQNETPILTIKVNFPKTNVQKIIREIRKRVNSWTQVTVHIGSMAPGFQILIIAKGQISDRTQPFADIEIDNIQFTQCESIEVNWDTTLNCTFESGTCGWTDVDVLTNSKLDWIREKSSSVDPGYDHTSRMRPLPEKYGTWLRTRKELGMTGNNTATLMTIGSIESPNSHCLTFWYHMWGSNLAQFSLILNQYKSEYGGTILWLKKAPQSNNWIKESVTVQSSAPYYLMFRAALQPPNGRHEDSIGLDDITWTDGKCLNQPVCDFETDLCAWNSTDNIWERTVPSHSTDKWLKPRVDHTLGIESGAYVRLNSRNQKTGSLLTYTFNDSTPLGDLMPFTRNSMCLKFWYFRSTSSPYNNTLDVEVSTNHSQKVEVYTVWTINELPEWGIYNDQWMYARVNLTLINKDMIRFKGQLRDSQSAIAIDDIFLQPHPCEPIGWCDFESDFCGWNNLQTNPVTDSKSKNILWLRNSGSSTSTLNGPKADHTTGTIEGWYAFVPSDSQESGTAILISEPLTYQIICLQFYYQITSDSNIVAPKLQVLFTTPNGITQVMANITTNIRNEWIAFNITHQFQNIVKYRLMLKTLEGNITQSDVAIDDIHVWSDTCSDVAMNSGLVSTKSPVLSTPIPEIEKAFDCDFESIGCDWNTSLSNVWTVTHWTEGVSKIGPRVDHTLRTSEGHYLLFDTSKQSFGQSTIPYEMIVSNIMPFTESPNCLSFWYYSDSESYFNISVAYSLQLPANTVPNPLENILFTTPTVISNLWKQIRVQLPVMANISIAIAVVSNDKIIGALALDDILLNPGKCQLTGQMCDFSYNYCGFKVNRVSPTFGTKIGFMANEAILKNYKLNGPEWDHTTQSKGNYFLFANQAEDPSTYYRTELVIPDLPPTQYQSRCLKFWYQITGQNSNLQVFVVPTNQFNYYIPTWTFNSVSHTHWTMGELTVRAKYVHKIVFSLSKSKDMNYIALDDISISDGVCEPPVSCNFDVDWCDWYFLDGFNDTNWKWGRFAGTLPDLNWPGPLNDHTLNKQGGFLYLTAYRDTSTTKKLRKAYIESMPVSTNQSNCFSFYAQIIGSDASLQVFGVQFSRINGSNRTQMLQTIKTPTQKWTQFYVKLDSTLSSQDVEVAFRFKGSFSESDSFIALDDISLSSNTQCDGSSEEAFYCSNGLIIDSIRVCNFVNDCSQGEDEIDCGTCDFENGMCGWTNTWKVNNQLWIRKSSDNRMPPIGPLVDGQNKANGYYMIIQKDNIGYDRTAQLESSIDHIHRFKRSHTTCRMSFSHYINGKDATLRVVVKEGPSSFNYIWRTIGSSQIGSQFWQKTIAVDIGEHRSPFSVEFEGDIQSKTQVVAIDDITFQSCGPVNSTIGVCPDGQLKCPGDNVCINQFSLCDGINDCGSLWDESYTQCSELLLPKCTFESNTRCPEIFTIESDKGSNSQWFLVNTALFDNLGRKTGPANDHTFRLMGKGIYLALNGSVQDQNTTSRLITFWMHSSGQKCAIRLFYYMYGSDTQMGSLRIYGRTKSQTIMNAQPIFQKGNLGQQWFRAILAINSSTPFQFVIEGQVGAGNEADIAIDDISFSSECIRVQSISSTTINFPTSKGQTPSSTHLITLISQTSQKGTTVTQSSITAIHTSINPISNKITEHSTNAPSTSMPSTSMPSTSMPSTSMPSTSMPSTSMPSTFQSSVPSSVSLISTKSIKTTQTPKKISLESTTIANTVGNRERADTKKGMGPYGMTASISAPILVLIAVIIGFIFYRRYQRNKSEDTIPLNPTVIHLTERNN